MKTTRSGLACFAVVVGFAAGAGVCFIAGAAAGFCGVVAVLCAERAPADSEAASRAEARASLRIMDILLGECGDPRVGVAGTPRRWAIHVPHGMGVGAPFKALRAPLDEPLCPASDRLA